MDPADVVSLPMTKPFIDVNSYHAYGLSIIQTSPENSLAWIMMNYIQLYGVPDSTNGDFIHFTTSSHFSDIPRSYVSRLHIDDVYKFFPNIVDFVMDRIRDGHYVNTILDEYYIPGTRAYGKYPFTHNILIHGFDRKKGVFQAAGYWNKPAVYAFGRNIPFKAFEQAFRNIAPISQYMNQTFEMIRYPYDSNRYIDAAFNIDVIKAFLLDYLEGKPHIERDPKRIRFVYGTKVYGLLTDMLVKQLNAPEGCHLIHLKTLQTIVNHKQMMAQRVNYLLREGWIRRKSSTAGCAGVQDSAENIHNIFAKYIWNKDKALLERMIVRTNDLVQKERAFIEALLEDITTGGVHRARFR
ncbi:hypothetical protein DNH61_06300 [Paenibacillus sambharensis]|uniref:Uncharacterized protein n=1 Tax=Paenibacillus sambharensis TaxID=1803190 RepID=A0A2W1LPM1_9BACL|nr:hypothetical protein [Paenibacillus sambharensis]PZD96805.1 hypothetical protein DNH61_06300 [Paenibacillus sambharensis]